MVWNEIILALELHCHQHHKDQDFILEVSAIPYKNLCLQEEDMSKMYMKIYIYSVLDYSSPAEIHLFSFSTNYQKKNISYNEQLEFPEQKIRKSFTQPDALNLYHTYTINGDPSSRLRLDIQQRKA